MRREPHDQPDQFLRLVKREKVTAALERGHLNTGDERAVMLAL